MGRGRASWRPGTRSEMLLGHIPTSASRVGYQALAYFGTPALLSPSESQAAGIKSSGDWRLLSAPPRSLMAHPPRKLRRAGVPSCTACVPSTNPRTDGARAMYFLLAHFYPGSPAS